MRSWHALQPGETDTVDATEGVLARVRLFDTGGAQGVGAHERRNSYGAALATALIRCTRP